MTHQCDLSVDPRGGLLTYQRALTAITAVLSRQRPNVIETFDECQSCRVKVTQTLAVIAAGAMLTCNPEVQMGLELQLAVVDAALARGEVDTPPEGFRFE